MEGPPTSASPSRPLPTSSNSSEPPPLLPLPALRRCCSETHGNGREIGYASALSKPAFSLQNNSTRSRISLLFLCSHLLLFISEGEFRRTGSKMVSNAMHSQQHWKQIANIIVSMPPANPGQHIQRLRCHNTVRGFPVVHLPGSASILSLFDAKWVQNECLVTPH